MVKPELILKMHKDRRNSCLKAIKLELLKVNKFESKFLDLIGEKLSTNKYLSFKQFTCLSKIYERIEQ